MGEELKDVKYAVFRSGGGNSDGVVYEVDSVRHDDVLGFVINGLLAA